MAAAEARAVWQRTNRCFVQEDARRAPNFSGCPESSSSKSESDDANGQDQKTPICMCPNSNSDLSPGTKWWLHPQHNFGNKKECMCEHFNALEVEYLTSSAESVKNDGAKSSEDYYKAFEAFYAHTGMKKDNDHGTITQEVNQEQPTSKKDTGELWYPDDYLMDLDLLNCLEFEQSKKIPLDLESRCVGAEKSEPWWRTAGKDELAFLVAQKSLEHIENCDLPRPQTKHFRKGPSDYMRHSGLKKIGASSIDGTEESELLNLTSYTQAIPSSLSGHNPCSTTDKDWEETQDIAENYHSKAQLLEALRHSQTRAREAEKVAKEAYNEKEHIIKLFFRQTSQLFAYKLWFQLLQLENLYLQLKNTNHPISTLFPDFLPKIPYKGRLTKDQCKSRNRKRSVQRHEVSNSAVRFAVGLGLAGAGLLLCWTMGWLFPNR